MEIKNFDWQHLAAALATIGAMIYAGRLAIKKLKSFLPSKKTANGECPGCGACEKVRFRAPGRGV